MRTIGKAGATTAVVSVIVYYQTSQKDMTLQWNILLQDTGPFLVKLYQIVLRFHAQFGWCFQSKAANQRNCVLFILYKHRVIDNLMIFKQTNQWNHILFDVALLEMFPNLADCFHVWSVGRASWVPYSEQIGSLKQSSIKIIFTYPCWGRGCCGQ